MLLTPCKLFLIPSIHLMEPRWSRFFSRLFPGEWEPCGGATSRVSRYASARKSQDRLLSIVSPYFSFSLVRSFCSTCLRRKQIASLELLQE